MSDPDKALTAFKEIITEFIEFCNQHGKVSEADTRVKLIDRILKEVLSWTEPQLRREDHTNGAKAGYTDYQLLIRGSPYIAVEAKREGLHFVLPQASGRRHLKISGIIQTSNEVRDAINQVRQYCIDDVAIKYAIVTNGYAWIIFRAIPSSGKSWKEGTATVFYSTDDIADNFIQFWNLLANDSIIEGSLENEFASISISQREQHRVIKLLYDADQPLARNRLHAQLAPVIDTFFMDIADKEQVEILESCYVHSRSADNARRDFDNVINDLIPLFLKHQGAEDLLTGKMDSGQIEKEISEAIGAKSGHLFLLLGGIGSGKTTFIKRYLRITGTSILHKNALPFYIDLLGPPPDSSALEKFVYEKIVNELRAKYSDIIKESRKTLKRIYAHELSLLHESTLKSERLSTDEYERRISPYLDKWKLDTPDYVARILKECVRRGKAIIFLIDNVDQLNPDYQNKIFLLAQKLTRDVGSITILALREESYYATSTQKTLTAYASKKFHIISPRFRKLIQNRLDYAISVLRREEEQMRLILKSGFIMDKDAIIDFLDIIKSSIFGGSRSIAKFIESICYGNMRLALDMFNTFLVSGATDADKILRIYTRYEHYTVPLHEFIKSVILRDRRYYKETNDNPIMNIFDCGLERNSSHFTGLRLIKLISSYSENYSPIGRGFIDLTQVIYEFEACFDNIDDVVRTINRMLWWKLLEVNTKSPESIEGASHVKCTPAGIYYAVCLSREFSYLDLVLQDTPLNDKNVSLELAELMKKVDNLSGSEEEKYQRTLIRFERVDRFLQYLDREEKTELSKSSMPVNPIFSHAFMPSSIASFEKQKRWIIARYKENLEKYHGIIIDEAIDEEDEAIIPGLLEVYDIDENDGSVS
jgi:hypothetical protein